ncbi:MAG: amino acid ABC transporter substrate-binding protein [Acetobacteraceae bacterium]
MRRREMMLGAAALAAPAIKPARAQTAKTIVFGGSVPLTGAAAETGLNVNNGYLTAADYLNDVLGGVEIAGEKYKIALKLFDDASDPARATTLIQRQIDAGTDFFLGSFGSNIVLPTAAITERARKPMVQTGGGSDAIFTRGFKYNFGMYPRATRQFDSSAAMFKTVQPTPRTYSVMYTNDAFSKTAAEGVRLSCDAAGFRMLESYGLPEKPTDVSSVLGSVRAKTPDMLVCVMHDQDSLLVARQMIASGTNVKLLYQTLGPQLATFRQALGKYADGLFTITYWDERVPYKDKFFGDSRKFAAYYKSKFTRPIAYHTAGAAACILTFILAMQEAKSLEPQAVRDALAAADYQTFYSRIKFTPQGDGDPIIMGAMVGQVQEGDMQIVFPADARSAAPLYPSPPWDKKA